MTTTCFRYKNFTGSVEVSIEDKCLHGKLEFIHDLVTYEAATVPELEKEFHEAVDDYIATCATAGKEPEKPFSGTFNVRIGAELHRKVAIEARKEGQTLNDFVKQTLEDHLEHKGEFVYQANSPPKE